MTVDKFEIELYLEKLSGENKNKGKCRVCEKTVPWSRQKVICHKRASCKEAPTKEKEFFKNLGAPKTVASVVLESSLNSRTSPSVTDNEDDICSVTEQPFKKVKTIVSFVDTLTITQRDNISEKFASLFYRTGIPFNIAGQKAMKEFIKSIRPVYVDSIPSPASLGGALLKREYSNLQESLMSLLNASDHFSLVTDGWSNVRNEHLVNFVVLIPNSKPFFLKSVSTAGVNQTSKAIADEIFKVIEELGPKKCVSVVTDNAANMRGAWDLIESKYPHIFANGCGAHVMNLLIKDICCLDNLKSIIDNCQSVSKFVRRINQVYRASF
jgi:hypothetical protein